MASEKESPCQNFCANDPNFAIICSFFDRFSLTCGITHPTFSELQEMIENTQDVPLELVDLHVKLLRKIRRSVTTEKWERALIKFCHTYLCSEEGWELERCGYKKCKVPVRLKILKTLLDAQFDLNSKFKNDINKLTPEELRLEPLGRDKVGQSYWCQFDSAANVRVYKEDQDEETWSLVAKDREGLVGLITQLSSGKELLELELINEDSNSQEVENPIIDTGQVEQTTSEENTVDSVTSKTENSVKEEANGITHNSVFSNGNSLKEEILEDEKSSEIKLEDDKDKVSAEPKNNVNVPFNDSHDQVCPPINDEECLKVNLEDELKSNKSSPSDSKEDICDKTDSKHIDSSSAQETDSEYKNGKDVSSALSPDIQQPKADNVQVGEVKDVAEEIKQRSLFKSSNSPLFKGKTGKPNSGSKLEKLFSHKLEQTNVSTSSNKQEAVDSEEKSLENKGLTDEESCSQSSALSNEQESVIISDSKLGKRKADEECDQPSKKICVDKEEPCPEMEPEVGEEIEEPVMIIKGEGSGQECDTGNPGKNNEEGVASENVNNTTSNNSNMTVTNPSSENNVSDCTGDQITLKNSLNNGIIKENCKINEEINKDLDCIPNCITPSSEKDDSECNQLENKDDKTSSDNKLNKCLEEPKIEKSIEEQLSDLTGEGLSPNSNFESQSTTENIIKHNVTLCSNKASEKGIRRKSLDSTDGIDNETIPPEAKKTKVENDCNDIFGTDDSIPYSREESNFDEENGHSKDSNCENSEKFASQKIHDETKVSEINEAINLQTNSCAVKPMNDNDTVETKTISLNDQNNLEKKKNDDNSELTTVKEIEKNVELQESKDCASQDVGYDSNKVSDTKEIIISKEKEDKMIKTPEQPVADPNLDEQSKSIIECTQSGEVNSEVKELGKSIENNCSDSTEETPNDMNRTRKATENEEFEHPEKKKKTTSEDGIVENKKEESQEKNLHDDDGKELLQHNEKDTEGEKTDSPSKDENKEPANKRKAPLKKSPKPRRKVFTPKSRKNRNKNKDLKPNNPEISSSPENKSNSQKPTVEENVLPKEVESANDKNSISENLETKKTIAKPIAGRKRRNSRKNTNTEKESEEDFISDKKTNTEADEEEIGGKRRKVKGKRAPNKELRKSIEDKRNCKSSSEEENQSDESNDLENKHSPKESKKTSAVKQKQAAKGSKTTKEKPKPNVKSPPKSKKNEMSKIKKDDSNGEEEDEISDKKNKKAKSQGRNSRAYLGINLDIDLNDTSRSVRQSSRIAQIKIKEQADTKHGEEHRQCVEKSGKKNKKKKDDGEEALKGTPKKKKKTKKVSEEDVPEDEPLSERKKRKKKRKHPVKAFNERDPWKSSSGSSSEAEEEEEDHFDDIVEEEEEIPLTIKSDHEFSPESDLEADEEWKPVRRARTAQKVKEPTEEAQESSKDLDDFACEKCGKKDHPEWILLCDTCNQGWHASCLRPSLMLVPEGDWHCPPCQHATLVKKLQETLRIYDKDTKRRENEELRRKRLAYVGISLDNVLPANANVSASAHQARERGSGSESGESSESRSESESEYSDEPVYQLRQRRQGTTSYQFNEYDELINSAIRDEVEGSGVALPGDHAPITATVEGVAAVKEGEDKPPTEGNTVEVNGEHHVNSVPVAKEKEEKPKKKIREESDEESSEEDSKDEEDEFPRVVPKRTALPRPGRKKHRKLNSLDDPSDDDDDDEDFKGSSSEEEEEEDDEDEDSGESGVGRRRSRRGNLEPVRRSSRARKSRFDNEFINDDSEESDAPRRKKTKKLWSDSDSESDDSTWGRRKKKKGFGSSRGKKFKKSKKFTIEDELSDIEGSKTPKKKRQRKIKYGGLDELAVEELPSRRTRGKKINYQEVLGTDSDEDIQKTKSFKKTVIEDDDEFDAEKEKQESAASSGEEDESENEEKSSEEDDGSEDDEVKEVKSPSKNVQNKENEQQQKRDENEELKPLNEKVDAPTKVVSPSKVITAKVSPPKVVNKDKPPARRGRPPKAMIAPPPERLVSEDEQYKAIVSKVATVGHNMSDIVGAKAVNVSDYPQKFSETKDFMEPSQPVTPIKIPNSSFDPKLVKRSPPIKIRSGVAVNAGMKSPTLGSPTSETSLFPVKSSNSGSLHSPPDNSQFLRQRPLMPQQPTSARKTIDPALTNIKTEGPVDEDLDDEDLMEEIEEEEDDDEEDDSDDDILEEGEIPKKVAKRMARMEERMERLEKRKLAKQMEKLKSVQSGSVTIQPVSPGAAQPSPTAPTSQPTQPLLRVVSPLKLMANPPGPLQSTFMNPGLNPRMPLSSPPSARIPMPMRPQQPAGEATSRRGRGRGKRQEKEEMMVGAAGGSVIRGMLQQPQSYPPAHYQQQYPPSHPRLPFSPQQRMARPPFHSGHPHPMDPSPSGGGPINVKQEPGAHPVSSPVHIPNKPPAPQSYHPQHRFDARPPGYPPQSTPRPQYGSYPPPPVSGAGYHYGSYPPPPQPSREEYAPPPQPQYNEQFSEQPPVNPPPPSKSYSEEEGGGEFGGLVSYFSSQREDDIDT